MVVGAAIGIAVFLLLRVAGQLIHLLFLLGILLVQIFLLLLVDGAFARTRCSVPFGLILVGSVLWHLYAVRPL